MTQGEKSIRIGGASGYWGESAMATPQLLKGGGLDYIVYDYLAEITMSIMARARAKDPSAGYATDFVSDVIKPNLKEIAAHKVRIISNAGGVNPDACAKNIRAIVAEQSLNLKVAVITGDDLIGRKVEIARIAPRELFTDEEFPPLNKVASINAYLGAFPIANALERDADIIITGRCVDSALTLGACIHAFGWQVEEWDKLASGSLAGHILECGPQATGGNFTDWRDAGDIEHIGYPIAEISADGSFLVTKPAGSGGVVNVGTVSEQLLYEIGDPASYILPDVICDFSEVTITQAALDSVRVSPAKGRPGANAYKTSLTYEDGFRSGMLLSFAGIAAEEKARLFAETALNRTRSIFRKFNAGDFTETSIEILGDPDSEVVLKLAVRHPDAIGAGLLLKEIAGLGLATPPGLSIFAGGRPKPSPVVRLFSYLTTKQDITITIDIDGDIEQFEDAAISESNITSPAAHSPPDPVLNGEMKNVALIKLAWARSGDKGDKANIGVIARKPEYLPFIWKSLNENFITDYFKPFLDMKSEVVRYYLPGTNAINFVLDRALGGGGAASLRNDPQGKSYAQRLLSCTIPIPVDLAQAIK